jgi:hypothetical protein
MQQADARGIYGAEYLEVLLAPHLPDHVRHAALGIDLPPQHEVDRALAQYESFVTVSAGGPA